MPSQREDLPTKDLCTPALLTNQIVVILSKASDLQSSVFQQGCGCIISRGFRDVSVVWGGLSCPPHLSQV